MLFCDRNGLSQTIKVKHYSRPEINDMLFSSRKSAGSNNMTGDGKITGSKEKPVKKIAGFFFLQ